MGRRFVAAVAAMAALAAVAALASPGALAAPTALAAPAPAHSPAGGAVSSNRATSESPGAGLYRAYCSVCHGERGDGRSRARESLQPPPIDFTSPASVPRLGRERMIDAVRNGRPGTAMVGWRGRLDDASIVAIVDHIRERFVVADGSGFGVQATLPAHSIGRVDAGRRIYESNCNACHGPNGDGKGPRARFIVPPPRDFTSASSRLSFDRSRISEAVLAGRNGTEMPAWRTVLDAQQVADVTEYVFSRFVAHRELNNGQNR